MKKGKVLALVVILSTILLLSFVSANWFTDVFNKVTGKAIDGSGSGLIGYWSFDGNANDASGNGNNGVLMNGPVFSTSGKLGDAVSLDGVNDYVNLGDPSGITNAMPAFTISAWVKPTGFVNSRAHVIFSDGYTKGIDINGDSSKIDFFMYPYSGFKSISSTSPLVQDTWYHVVGTYDFADNSKGMKLYVNGVLESNGSTNGYARPSASAYGIGYDIYKDSKNYFKGYIDEVRVYNRALSADEVLSLYNLVPPQTNATVCTDSDGGDEIYINGNTYGPLISSQMVNHTDRCIMTIGGSGGYWVDSCEGLNCSVDEAYCKQCTDSLNCGSMLGRAVVYTYPFFKSCPNGCVDGACVAPSASCEENYQIRVMGFKMENKVPKASIQAYDNGQWITLSNSKAVGEVMYLGNLEIKFASIDYANSEAFLSINSPGTFDYVYIDSGEYILVNSTTFNFDYKDMEYVIVSYCGSPQVCPELIDYTKYPTSFDNSGIYFELTQNDTYVGSWNGQEYKEYTAGWNANQENMHYYQHLSTMIFDNPNFNASNILAEISGYNFCVERMVAGNWVYVCNYDPLNLEDGQYYDIMWVNNNVLIRAFIASRKNSLSLEEQSQLFDANLQSFLEDLKNNEFKSVYSSFEINPILGGVLQENLIRCSSEIVSGKIPYSYSCKIEPVICPPHGYQTQKCISWVGNQEVVKENQLSCSPGICAGCTVPKWFGNTWDNKCIPYGFRFSQTSGSYDKLSQGEVFKYVIDELNVPVEFKINSDNTAIVEVLGNIDIYNITRGQASRFSFIIDGNEYNGKKGESLIIYPGYHYFDITFYDSSGNVVSHDEQELRLNKIVYNEDNSKSYLEFVNEYNFNAYCDIDGWVKQQKSVSAGQDWAKCQNNYECESNICSYGECIEIKNLLNEANAFRATFVRVICKLSNLFDLEEYNQCVYDYLGETPATSSPSSGGGGSSSSSSPPAMPS